MRTAQVFLFALVCFTAVNCEQFQKILFKDGIARISNRRMLDLPLTTIYNATSINEDSLIVTADLGSGYNEKHPTDEEDGDTRMQLLLYANQSALYDGNGGCDLLDEEYDCDSSYCVENTTNIQSIISPWFNATDATTLTLTNSSISIANQSWVLKTDPLYIHNCQSNDQYYEAVDNDGIGWIGLGLSAGAENFENTTSTSTLFSVLIDSDSYGELIFGYNSTYVDTSVTPITIYPDLDWKLNVSTITFGSTSLPALNGSIPLVFDLQYQGIALPRDQFKSIMFELLSFSDDMECEFESDDTDLTDLGDCFTIGDGDDDYSKFPTLVFGLSDGSSFSLTPSMYLDDGGNTFFEVYNDDASGANYTVIGTTFLSKYYSVFGYNGTNTNITLYSYPSEIFNSDWVPDDGTTGGTTNGTTGTTNETTTNGTTGTTNETTTNGTTGTTNGTTGTTNETTTNGTTGGTDNSGGTTTTPDSSTTTDDDSDSHKTVIIVVVVVVVVALSVIGFIGIRKGWWNPSKRRALQQSSLEVELKKDANELHRHGMNL